jgi:hypothetical protein
MEIVKNCDQRKYFLKNRVANAWNKLPSEVVHAPSVSAYIVSKQKLIINPIKQIQKEPFVIYLNIIHWG